MTGAIILAAVVRLALEPTAVEPPKSDESQSSADASAAEPLSTFKGTQVPGEPGSGSALVEPTTPPDPKILQSPLPRRARDDTETKGLDELETLLGRYRNAHRSMAHTIAELLVIENVRGQAAIEQESERAIQATRFAARQQRTAAIARFRDFLRQHPGDARWTPEIMFRLAELHVEESTERLTEAEDAFQKALEIYAIRLEQDPNAPAPESPTPDHATAIELYRELVTRFPRFHLDDGALYMMGTLLSEMDELEQSRRSYLALACANQFAPPQPADLAMPYAYRPGDYQTCAPWKAGSKYAPEAWLRVGESHYDEDELDQALEAYAQVAGDPEADLYDEALIRMAWTLYLMRRFPEAAVRFDEFIRYADAHEDDGDKAGGALGLRGDAIRYLAKTYLEDDWDLDGRRDSLWGLRRLDRDYRDRGQEKHVPEIYAALGDLFADETRYDAAIDIWQLALSRWPLAAAAPSIDVRVIDAYLVLREPEAAARARDRLATLYQRGTAWFFANESDPEVVEAALKLAEEALVATALDHHAKAQQLRETDLAAAKAEYAIAAKAYQAYLERFPDTPSSYDYRYNFAEALYYGDRFIEAAQQYVAVRDSNIDDRLQETAASGAVLAFEAHVEAAQRTGQLQVPEMPKEGMKGPFEAKPIPAELLQLRDAYDEFVKVRPDSEQAGSMRVLAGSISQKYFHFDDAQRRFEEVLEAHCDENVAINAGLFILDGKVVREDLDGVREWTRRLGESDCGTGEEKTKFAGQLKTLGNAVRFKEATLLYDAGDFEAAADRYVALVNEAPADPNADRALNNAAVAYENIGRFGSATATFRRIYSQYPNSEFADDALLRTGFNHARFFEFEDAVTSYVVLAEDERYKDSEHREDALWNAASLLDNLQEYSRASQMFGRFAAKSEDQAKAAEATFRAAMVLGKTSDHRATIAAYEAFIAKYRDDPAHAEHVIEAHLRIGQAHAALGRRPQAEDYYAQTIALFESKGLKPMSEAADFPSQAQFLLAEYALADVLATKLKGTGAKLEAEFKVLTDRMLHAAAEYEKVFPYRRLDWVLAAMYRRGYAFETWAIGIRTAPTPKSLKEYSEAWWAYKDLLGNVATGAEEKAIVLYEETLQRAREFNIAGEWTQLARERLNIYKPEQYPLLRPPALDLQLGDL